MLQKNQKTKSDCNLRSQVVRKKGKKAAQSEKKEGNAKKQEDELTDPYIWKLDGNFLSNVMNFIFRFFESANSEFMNNCTHSSHDGLYEHTNHFMLKEQEP